MINHRPPHEALEAEAPAQRVFENPRTAEGYFGMTQVALAERFGVCKQRIDQIERNAIRKMRAEAERQAALAGVTVLEWLTGG